VKAVASHAFVIEALRNGIVICQGAMATMKCRVEAGDLRQFGSAREKRADRSEIVGLVQGRKRNITFKSRNDIRGHAHRTAILGPGVTGAMADGDKIALLGRAEPITRFLGCGWKVRHLFWRKTLVNERRLVGARGTKPRARADAVHLAFHQAV